MTTVKLPYQSSYAMPSICCACAEPAGRGTYTVSRTSGRVTFWLKFPLCDEHDQVYKRIARQKRIGCGVSLLPILLVIILIVLESSANLEEGSVASQIVPVIGGLLLSVAILCFIGGIIALIVINLRTPKPVQIKKFAPPGLFVGEGGVTFRFENTTFATLFAQANHSDIQQR